MSSFSPADPPPPATAAAASTGRLFTNPPPQLRDPRPQTPPPHLQPNLHTYPPQQQQQPPIYIAQPLPNLAPRVGPTNPIHHQSIKPHDHPVNGVGVLYPVASSGRGFIPKSIRPQLTDHSVTIANPGGGGFVPRSVAGSGYPHPVRPFGFPHPEPMGMGQTVHLMRPAHLHHSGGAVPGFVKGVPVSVDPKVAPIPPSVSECNGYKDIRDRSRDDAFVTVRDRKVRISDDSSLYALCRSWLRNSFPEESQPQYMDGVKSLPRPLPIPVADAHSPLKKERHSEEEDEEESVENLSPQDLLRGHIKRAKRVRARLRGQRLQRIARYKTRLALLLPPLVDQQFTNDSAAGNLQNPSTA